MSNECVGYYCVDGIFRVVFRGAVSGAAGALAFAGWAMGMYQARQGSLWMPLNIVASSVWAGAPAGGRFSVGGAALGLGLIFAVGCALGIGYSLLALNAGFRPVMVVVGAFTLAIVLWVFGQFMVWPAVNAATAARFDTLTAWLGHGIYGLVTGLVLVVLERGTGLTEKPGGDPEDFALGAVDKPLDKPHPFRRRHGHPPAQAVH